MLDREVRLFHVRSYGEGRTGPLDHARRRSLSRAEFRASLHHVLLEPDETKDVVGAWVPVDAKTREDGATDRARSATHAYELPTEVGRHLENVTGSSASSFLDIDKIPAEKWAWVLSEIRARGWSGEAWSTASYKPESGLVSARVHLHLSRELSTANEVRFVRRGLSAVLGNVADRMCFQQVAVFYLPASRGAHFVEIFDGPTEVDVDSLPVPPEPARKERHRAVPAGYVVTERDLAIAEEELASLAWRIRFCTSGLRRYAELAALSVGQRIAAGVLTEAAAKMVLEEALRFQNYTFGDEVCTIDERLEQLDRGIADGVARGAALPADVLTPLEEVEDEAAGLTVDGAPVPAISANAASEEAERIARDPEPAVLALPPGVGKSRAALRLISSSAQEAVIYAPSHALAEEHGRQLIAMGVSPAAIRHEMSPLHRPAGGEEGCERSRASRPDGWPEDKPSPFAAVVYDNHINLRASVCPHCPLRQTCVARFGDRGPAKVRLRVHSAYEPVDEPGKRLVFLDEEPTFLEEVRVTPAHLATLIRGDVLGLLSGARYSMMSPAELARAAASFEASSAEDLARRTEEWELSDRAGDPPTAPTFEAGQGYYVRQAALALRAGREIPPEVRAKLVATGDVLLSADVAAHLALNPAAGLPAASVGLEAVRVVSRLGAAVGGVLILTDGSMRINVRTSALIDVHRGWARLLSATPLPGGVERSEV